MYRVSIDFHKKLVAGESPIPYVQVTTIMGKRWYASRVLACGEDQELLECSSRLLTLGRFTRTIQAKNAGLFNSFMQKQQQHVPVSLDNTDRYFSRQLAKEPFLGRRLTCFLGYEDVPVAEHISLFSGDIVEAKMTETILRVQVLET